MDKITEIKGHRYSRKPFDGYKFRAKFEFDVQGERHFTCIDIYTDNPNKYDVQSEITLRATDKVRSIKMIHSATKEQDDLAGEFINEILNNM